MMRHSYLAVVAVVVPAITAVAPPPVPSDIFISSLCILQGRGGGEGRGRQGGELLG